MLRKLILSIMGDGNQVLGNTNKTEFYGKITHEMNANGRNIVIITWRWLVLVPRGLKIWWERRMTSLILVW